MQRYIHIKIVTASDEQRHMLIAMLAEAGFEGFEESEHSLDAFITEAAFDESALRDITGLTKSVYTKTVIEPVNWNKAWETSFEPVIISDFCAIRAEFHQPVSNTKHEIIITPKMSFGTGHHATTSLMIEAMRELDCKNKMVCDFGTGTGVLAILAEKSGALAIEAFDYDEWSIENAKENIRRNNCKRITLSQADHLQTGQHFDVILANINKNVIIAHLPSLKQHLVPGGTIVLSGFLTSDLPDIINSAKEQQLEVSSTRETENWLCLNLIDRQKNN